MAGGVRGSAVKLFFDGGWQPLHGMEAAVVLAGEVHLRHDLGAGSAMDAEWLALIAAMQLAVARDIAQPLLLGDAAAVIAQANGTVRCPAAYAHHWRALHALPLPPGRLRIRYIRRSHNLAGIALARSVRPSPPTEQPA